MIEYVKKLVGKLMALASGSSPGTGRIGPAPKESPISQDSIVNILGNEFLGTRET